MIMSIFVDVIILVNNVKLFVLFIHVIQEVRIEAQFRFLLEVYRLKILSFVQRDHGVYVLGVTMEHNVNSLPVDMVYRIEPQVHLIHQPALVQFTAAVSIIFVLYY